MSESSFVMEDNWRQRKSLMLIQKRAYLENCVSPAQMLLRRLFKPPVNTSNFICVQYPVADIHRQIFDAPPWFDFLHFHAVFRTICPNNRYSFGVGFPFGNSRSVTGIYNIILRTRHQTAWIFNS